jgi:hypothetical protein
LTPEVLTLFILNTLFLVFSTLALILSVKISLYYDKNATTSKQYALEKQSYLGSTIIKYIFAIKVPLFIFFIFTLEKISHILPGAMCSAGVVNATDYGVYLLMIKVVNLYLFAYWIILNTEDMKSEMQPYMKTKFQFFIPLYLLLLIEIILETMMFLSIDIKDVVDCCGVVFSTSDKTYMAEIIGANALIQNTLFYGVFIAMIIAYIQKKKRLFSIVNLLFALVSLSTLIGYFGTYIYEMPTHHCPFCFLAYEYNYIGYFLYAFLFIGTFSGMIVSVVEFRTEDERRGYRLSLLFNSAYVLLVSSYVLLYYIKNSVLL